MPIPARLIDAFDYLDQNKDAALPTVPANDRATELTNLRNLVNQAYDRKPEDLRAVVTIAVDAAKTLMAIGIAFFVAVGGFMIQYVGTHDSIESISFWCLVVSALLGIASMIAGFYAIGSAIRSAEGQTIPTAHAPWSTAPMKNALVVQSYAGLLGLVVFGVALAFWSTPPTGGLAASPVPASSTLSTTGHKIRIEGTWTNLTVRRGTLSFSPTPLNPPGPQALDVDVP
jgi:hypothetical protein